MHSHRFLTGCLACVLAVAAVPVRAGLGPRQSLDLPPPSLQPLVQGLMHDMDVGSETLDVDGKRRLGTEALDRARRLARTLDEASSETSRQEARAARDAVERARHALQNGDAHEATEILRGASHQLMGFDPRGTAGRAVGPADAGKLVIDAQGRRVGRLDHLERDGQGGWQAVMKVGGAIDWLGFIDWNNRLVRVPARRLVAGDRLLALDWPTTTRDLAQRYAAPSRD